VDLDLTTFALEVLNFLVLVWLLQRFLYRPVMDVIERRRAEQDQTVAAAQSLQTEAQALKADYEQRLARAGEDRDRALAALDAEIAAERSKRLAAVAADEKAERERLQSLATREREQQDAERERRALALGARFTARLLDRLAGPALEASLVDLALADLPTLPADRLDDLRGALAAADSAVEVATAHPLPPARRDAVARALEAVAGKPVTPAFVEDPALKAGLRVRAGAWVLMANLRDELAYFAAGVDHGG
jgi:F-type H+-transporting ATPase subunit b